MGICGGDDSIEHVSVCFGYRTRSPPNMREEDLSSYLIELNRERIQRWEAPIINVDVNMGASLSGGGRSRRISQMLRSMTWGAKYYEVLFC